MRVPRSELQQVRDALQLGAAGSDSRIAIQCRIALRRLDAAEAERLRNQAPLDYAALEPDDDPLAAWVGAC